MKVFASYDLFFFKFDNTFNKSLLGIVGSFSSSVNTNIIKIFSW